VRRITSRFVLLVATAAVLPLVLFGVVSVSSLRSGTNESVRAGNLNVAKQAAEQVEDYMQYNTRVLQLLGSELGSVGLTPWQLERTLRDYPLKFPEFKEITLFNNASQPIASSAVGKTKLEVPEVALRRPDRPYIEPVTLDEDGMPTTRISVRLPHVQEDAGWIVGEISLESLWRMVGRIKIGKQGFALIVSDQGQLIAHGNPDKKRDVAATDQSRAAGELAFAAAVREGRPPQPYTENGEEMLAVGQSIPPNDYGVPPWVVMVEQPMPEAMATAKRLELQLLVAIVLALLGTMIFGYAWARDLIQRIFALTRVTRSLADGKMETRVALSGHDEIRELGDAFNSMADKLVELQDNIRKQERQVMFGRIAAGLVHDLSHPIQNIGNSCKLILKMWEDAEYRDTFRRMVEREMQVVKRVLEDLQNIAKPIPLEKFPIELNRTVGEAVEAMQSLAETAGITLRAEIASGPLYIEGDLFALGRVYRNLVVNAIQATAPGGLVVAAVEAHGDRVQVRVYDTGCGIPPDRLQAIFEDFVTTKRRGLGLGLAISRKIVEQLGGRISVASEVGKGTTFVIDFPRSAAPPMAQAAG
jgi:signal transduction histidine kinase